jgi:acyl-ACP thioesterase
MTSLWVCVDTATGAPMRLPREFQEIYGSAANGRKVTSRRWLAGVDDAAVAVPWPLRATDIDLLGHVNNAAYWAAVEEQLLGEPTHPLLAAPHRGVIEYGSAITPGSQVELRVRRGDDGVAVWFTVAGTTHAAATVRPLPPAAAAALAP